MLSVSVLTVKCKGCGKTLPLGAKNCGSCGNAGLFTPGPLRKPVTPYNVRKDKFQRNSDTKKALEKIDFRQLKGTLLAAAHSDATRMALQPRHRVEWKDVELKTEIGEGAYAIVYEGAWQGQAVAVKEIKYQQASDEQMRDFVTEVTVLAALSHPNVIDFVGACTEPEHLAILLEFMPTGDASILLSRDDVQITWERRLSWLTDVARAMQYLHSHQPQIIHRDLKTENVLISADFQLAKVTDFGLSQAKAASFMTTFDLTAHLPSSLASPSSVSSPSLRLKNKQSPRPPAISTPSSSLTPKVVRKPGGVASPKESPSLKIDTNSATMQVPRKQNSGHAKRHSVDYGDTSLQKMRMQRLNMRHFSMEAGTPAYVAPEIWRCEAYSERVDSYSYAIVMWEFMTRDWAFDGLEVEEIIECVRDLKERPDIPHWCPRSYLTLLEDCWAETPLFRPGFDSIVRRMESMMLECPQWPSAPNEWPEFTREQLEQQYEEEYEEEVIEEEEYVEEEEVIEEEVVEVEEAPGEDSKASPMMEVLSPSMRNAGISPLILRSPAFKDKKMSLTLSADDMSQEGIENMLESFMEQYCEKMEQIEEVDNELDPAAGTSIQVALVDGQLRTVESLVEEAPVVVSEKVELHDSLLGLHPSLWCIIVSKLGLVSAVRARLVCRAWNNALRRPDLWRFLGVSASSLTEFGALSQRVGEFEGVSTRLEDGRLRAVFDGNMMFHFSHACAPSSLNPAVVFWEFEVVSPTDAVFEVGFASEGSPAIKGVSSEGNIFCMPGHPSSFAPLTVGSVRGIGLEWETRQIFVTHGQKLLYFEKIDDMWKSVETPLRLAVVFRSLAPTEIVFRHSGFLFDLETHLATRRHEVESYLKLLEQMKK